MVTVTTARPQSEFDLSRMPRDRIFKRTPMPWSVHHSLTTNKWIATLTRPDANSSVRVRHSQFIFESESEAKKFCKAFAPPKLCSGDVCRLCQKKNATGQRNCRNCGVTVCDLCSTRWGARMIPKTYSGSAAMTQRVCRSCDWLSNAFCLSLLQGRYGDALALHETGNVNFRTTFADIHQEAMFPIHCAVMGGCVELVKWLVDTHSCPISVKKDSKTGRPVSVQTSASRTLLDLAMSGLRPKTDILVYLIRKGLSITDVKDSALIPKTLEAILRAGYPLDMTLPSATMTTTTSSSNNGGALMIHPDVVMDTSDHPDDTSTCVDDLCSLCYENTMDCVLTPCGHQMCCLECGHQLQVCPSCKAPCSVLRVFRQ